MQKLGLGKSYSSNTTQPFPTRSETASCHTVIAGAVGNGFINMGNSQTQSLDCEFCKLFFQGHEAMLVVQLYLLPAVFVAVLALGLPLNLLSLWVFSCRLKRWTRGTLFLFNLALADTSWLLALPLLVQYHLDRMTWRLGKPLCSAVRLVYHAYFYLSIIFVSCVSLDRYLAIVHPLRSLVLLGRRPACLLCITFWALTMTFSYPVALMSLTQRCLQDNRTVCNLYVFLDNPRQSLPFSLACSCAGFLLPLAAISYCCARSVQELRSRPRFSYRPCRRRRLTRLLSATLGLFALLYLPYHLTRNVAIAMRAAHPGNPGAWQPADLAFSLEMCLCSLNSCVNPLFSYFAGSQFRQEFQDTLARLRCWRLKPQQAESEEDGHAAMDVCPMRTTSV